MNRKIPFKQLNSLELAKKWHVYQAGDLQARCSALGSGEYLVEDLLLRQSLGIVVGSSGHGKTPLLYQLAICIAAGIPFLGRKTQAGPVLYMDYENGVGEVAAMVARLTRYLGLNSPPANLHCWNLNDCHPEWGEKGNGLAELVQVFSPMLTIIDPLASEFPQAEEKNHAANEAYKKLRTIMRDSGTAFLNVHHLRKPSEDNGPKRLEDGDVKAWFNQARGASSLINGCDLRLGVDAPGGASVVSGNDDVALVVGGFGRVRGEIPTMRLARVNDEDGEPLGYRQLTGVALLANEEQQVAYNKLPPTFRFKEAKFAYGKASQPTTDFLRKCTSAGILRKTPQGYEKIDEAQANKPNKQLQHPEETDRTDQTLKPQTTHTFTTPLANGPTGTAADQASPSESPVLQS